MPSPSVSRTNETVWEAMPDTVLDRAAYRVPVAAPAGPVSRTSAARMTASSTTSPIPSWSASAWSGFGNRGRVVEGHGQGVVAQGHDHPVRLAVVQQRQPQVPAVRSTMLFSRLIRPGRGRAGVEAVHVVAVAGGPFHLLDQPGVERCRPR